MKQKNKVIENKNVTDYEDEAKSHGTKRLVNYKVKQSEIFPKGAFRIINDAISSTP